jgi:hypothetical protein
MGFKKYLINEIFVIGNETPQQDDTIIAYNKWVWVISDENWEEYLDDIKEKLGIDDDYGDLYDLISGISDDHPDVIVGSFQGDTLNLDNRDWRHSTASPTLLKIMKEFNLQYVEVSFYDEIEHESSHFFQSREEFLTPLEEKWFYHGTCYKFLETMLVKGLVPPEGRVSNFGEIKHEDKVFVTLNLEKANFHALKAAEVHESFPLIIKLKIPDVNRLVMDYDVALSMYGKDHDNTIELDYDTIHDYATEGDDANWQLLANVAKRLETMPNDINTKLGVFGYVGRIPASMFKAIILDAFRFEQFYVGQIAGYGEYDFGTDRENFRSLPDWESYNMEDFKELKQDTEEQYEEEMKEYEDE